MREGCEGIGRIRVRKRTNRDVLLGAVLERQLGAPLCCARRRGPRKAKTRSRAPSVPVRRKHRTVQQRRDRMLPHGVRLFLCTQPFRAASETVPPASQPTPGSTAAVAHVAAGSLNSRRRSWQRVVVREHRALEAIQHGADAGTRIAEEIADTAAYGGREIGHPLRVRKRLNRDVY